jgi:hypothetical protein
MLYAAGRVSRQASTVSTAISPSFSTNHIDEVKIAESSRSSNNATRK